MKSTTPPIAGTLQNNRTTFSFIPCILQESRAVAVLQAVCVGAKQTDPREERKQAVCEGESSLKYAVFEEGKIVWGAKFCGKLLLREGKLSQNL